MYVATSGHLLPLDFTGCDTEVVGVVALLFFVEGGVDVVLAS